MGVITKYLIRAHIGPFLFALSTLTALIFLNAVAQRVEGLVGKGLSWGIVIEFLVLSLPHTIALSLPISVLAAVLYGFSELTSSNEITAMSAGGIRPARIMIPMLGMGLVMTGVMLFFNDQVLPESNHRLKNLMVDIGRKSPTLEWREQVVNEIRTDGGRDTYFLTADRIDPATNRLEEVTIFDSNNSSRRRTTYAARGDMTFNEAKTDLYLTLYDGVVHEVQSDRVGGFQRLYFSKQIVPLRGVGNELDRRLGGTERSDREMGFALLLENAAAHEADLDSVHIEMKEKSLQAVRLALGRETVEDSAMVAGVMGQRVRGQVATTGNGASLLAQDPVTQGVVITARTRASRGENLRTTTSRYRVEIHKKLAIAMACLIFTLLAPPLAIRFPTGGIGMVVAASSGIIAICWAGLIGGESLADRGVASPAVTMWLANFVFLIVGLYLVAGMGRATGSLRGGALDGVIERMRSRVTRSRTQVGEEVSG
ncbi:MAG: LptF/LptG family permease [Gemmatimonadetes bacterium]|nr:LptF/LptG family permease [Gemmatimonadota bacterium]